MHALVAIALALCPAAQRQLDENIFNTLREKCAAAPRAAGSATHSFRAGAHADTRARSRLCLPVARTVLLQLSQRDAKHSFTRRATGDVSASWHPFMCTFIGWRLRSACQGGTHFLVLPGTHTAQGCCCASAHVCLNRQVRRARRYGEKMGKMVRGSEATHEELFSYACPKFVTCAPPNLDTPTANTNQARPVCDRGPCFLPGLSGNYEEFEPTIAHKTTGFVSGFCLDLKCDGRW